MAGPFYTVGVICNPAVCQEDDAEAGANARLIAAAPALLAALKKIAVLADAFTFDKAYRVESAAIAHAAIRAAQGT